MVGKHYQAVEGLGQVRGKAWVRLCQVRRRATARSCRRLIHGLMLRLVPSRATELVGRSSSSRIPTLSFSFSSASSSVFLVLMFFYFTSFSSVFLSFFSGLCFYFVQFCSCTFIWLVFVLFCLFFHQFSFFFCCRCCCYVNISLLYLTSYYREEKKGRSSQKRRTIIEIKEREEEYEQRWKRKESK